jgi:hypothetical protein
MWVKMSNARHNLRDHAAVVALERIEEQYGKVRRVWLMDRGVPTEEVLAEMRAADPPVPSPQATPPGRPSAAASPRAKAGTCCEQRSTGAVLELSPKLMRSQNEGHVFCALGNGLPSDPRFTVA